MSNFISEHQIEQALVQKLQHRHGFDVLNCHAINAEDLKDGSNRARKRDVILVDRVRDVAVRLNPDIPPEAIENALEKLCEQRQAMSLIAANQEIYGLLCDGIPVTFDNAQGQSQQGRVRLLDFNVSSNNRYLVVTQLWIKGRRGFFRPDVLLYVNGIPLVLIALKNSNVALRNAYDDNLTNFKAEIPQLFLTNAFCVLSNAIETKVGSITAQWQHYFNWLRTDDEKQQIDRTAIRAQGTSLESVIDGMLPQQKLLDYVENFVLYDKDTQKIIAQNHQFIGVNRAYGVFLKRRELLGKLGVFWHTQGSDKDFSMIFYVRKIFRKQTGNFTFVVVTDRDDLDSQIYHNFLHTRTVSETEAAQPKHSKEMRKFLAQNKRIVFTLIQKFRWDKNREYPELSARNDIIVILAKVHCSQYQSLMTNMYKGLPKANYLAFTDVPLLGRERKANAWFGSYVSEYNFQQSIDDGATVPLFYRKRVPVMLIQKEGLSEPFSQNLENEGLDEAQQTGLEQRLTKAAEIIRRDERLEKIARDIVNHFPRRGYLGKALLVSVDKFTAVKMYDKVQRLWKQEISTLKGIISKTPSKIEKRRLRHRVEFMRTVEMAVVISKDTGEKEKFAAQNLAIKSHRERMDQLDEYGHDIEYNYQDPEHPLQLVFVCAMWLTDFDAPTLSTLYLDKPMRGHTLMRTIARTNRVTSWKINEVEKRNGEIVDYCNVFSNLKLALKDYTQEDDETEWPVKEKVELFRLLDDAIEQGFVFCHGKAVALREASGNDDVFKQVGRFEPFANTLLTNDEWRRSFNRHENAITSLYEACKPEVFELGKGLEVASFQYLRGVIEAHIEQKDVDTISLKIFELLDESVSVVEGVEVLKAPQKDAKYQMIQKGKTWDLSKINVDKLREEFKQITYKHIEIADLRAFLQLKLELMLQHNVTRTDFVQRLQQIIDTYNAGNSLTESYYENLMQFTEDLRAEDERHIHEGLNEDELELFDLLKKDAMTQDETQQVKLAAKSLLHRLLEKQHPKVLVQDWYKDTQTQKMVRSAVEQVLDHNLPESYDQTVFREKCDNVFHLMLDYASHGRKWAA